jgi:hypothetical protein
MYVQYFLPANEMGAAYPLPWHGDGLTGIASETTPGWAVSHPTRARSGAAISSASRPMGARSSAFAAERPFELKGPEGHAR